MEIREYNINDLDQMIAVWNEIVDEGVAFPQEELLDEQTGKEFFSSALISWLRNPFNGNKAEVTVNSIKRKEAVFMAILALAVTILFFFILKAFGTANILPSTLSVTTSFLAVYLTFRRSPFYAVAYAANDAVLIILWSMASVADTRYISVVVCFTVFLINDIYSFFSWQNIKKRQAAVKSKSIRSEHTKV